MGYWTSYLGAGYPQARFGYYSDSGTLLYNVVVVGASLIVPALACLGFVWTRRWRYGPFFLAMVLVGVVVMSAGFPNGTPLRQVMNWVYYHVSLLSFLRTVDKAAPVAALGLAGLLGLAAHVAWARLRTSRILTGGGRRALLVAAPAALAALIALAAWPLFQGRAIDRQLTWKQIPAAWRAAGRDLDAHLPANSRAIVLPGQVFAFYKWGGTIDSILPRLTDKPVAVRYETPYSDLHADDLLVTIDNLVQQGRLYGGQLKPLLGLIGASSVISGTDDDTTRSGAVDPSSAARALATQGLGTPHDYGPLAPVPAAPGSIDPPQRLAQVRQFSLSPGRGIVHVDQGPPTVVDGSAQGLADLAAFGQLPARAPVFYAGDLTRAAIQSDAASGADIVITDSNRRQVFSPQFTRQDFGPVLTAGEPITADEATLNPFAANGTAAQTVTLVRGARALQAPSVYGLAQFPELGPLAAFDGNLSTSWVPYPNLPPAQRWVQIDFSHPRDVPYIDVFPLVGPPDDGQVGGHRRPDLPRVPRRHPHCAARPRHLEPAHRPGPRRAPELQQRPRRPARGPYPRRPRLRGPAPAAGGLERAGRPRPQPRLADLAVRPPDRRRPVPCQPLRRRARPERSRRRPGSRDPHRPSGLIARPALLSRRRARHARGGRAGFRVRRSQRSALEHDLHLVEPL